MQTLDHFTRIDPIVMTLGPSASNRDWTMGHVGDISYLPGSVPSGHSGLGSEDNPYALTQSLALTDKLLAYLQQGDCLSKGGDTASVPTVSPAPTSFSSICSLSNSSSTSWPHLDLGGQECPWNRRDEAKNGSADLKDLLTRIASLTMDQQLAIQMVVASLKVILATCKLSYSTPLTSSFLKYHRPPYRVYSQETPTISP